MIRNFISKLYSLYTPSFFMSGGGGASGYVIERSLRFSAASSNYLTRTFSTPTNNTVWTWSKWLKRGSLGSIQCLFSAGSAGVFFNASDQLIFTSNAGATLATSTKVFRDPSAHGHLKVSSDGTTITAHWNNELCLSYTGTITNINSAIAHNIGRNAGGSNQHFDGYDSEDVFVDGQSLASSSFGETNTATGQWVAKRYSGTYGTNGSYLDFKDGTSTTTLGDDKSGNNNDWTLTNFTRSAGVNDCWMRDVPAGNGSASAVQPSGNYAVFSPLMRRYAVAQSTVSQANLRTTGGSTYSWGTIGIPTSGKYYWEMTVTAGSSNPVIGVDDGIQQTSTTNGNYVGYLDNGDKILNATGSAYGATYTTGDVVGVAIDRDANTITFYKNNISQGSISNTFTGWVFPFVNHGGGWAFQANFGQRSFAYTPPAGFKALCTANLPVPSIKKPSDHFNVQLSTGANIKTDSEALFTNELEWIKDRANTNNHQLIDSVRGSTAVLQSNTTAAETTYTAPSGSSVGWVWRASDSAAVTNNNGSISSQVSANVAAGFSIVEHINTGAASTIGHGLGVAPKIIINKVYNRTENWRVYFGIANKLLILNSTGAEVTDTSIWDNTQPTSSVFSIGTYFTSGDEIISYCFAEIPGYSKFGTYVGNGSADGPSITLGFTARFLLVKQSSSAGNPWVLIDTLRETTNPNDTVLNPNTTAIESTGKGTFDITSNSFKVRTVDGTVNTSGATYIYMAFAESPFQYANAH